jgi:hypothetical protein
VPWGMSNSHNLLNSWGSIYVFIFFKIKKKKKTGVE